jgi:hypothetical protein
MDFELSRKQKNIREIAKEFALGDFPDQVIKQRSGRMPRE